MPDTDKEARPGRPGLGMCCICLEEHPTVRSLIMLDVRAPKPGTGCWGCFQCGLPMEGAIAVLCDNCLVEHTQNKRPISLACVGQPADNQRVSLVSLTEPFEHDLSKHPEKSCSGRFMSALDINTDIK